MTTPDDSGPRRDDESTTSDGEPLPSGGEATAPGGESTAPGGEAPASGGEAMAPAAARSASSSGPDRVYRSGAGIGGGVLLLALIAWLGIDAVVRGQGDTPWKALATMLLLVPLVSAFTLRPAVYANDDRLRIRNPFRTITLPWASVAALRSGYSNEAVAQSGTKYQLWAIPVSLRARKRAGRAQARAAAAESGQGGLFGRPRAGGVPGAFGGAGGRPGGAGGSADGGTVRAQADRSMDDLRELAEARSKAPGAQGEPEVKWCYEVVGPAVAGLVLLAVLLGVG